LGLANIENLRIYRDVVNSKEQLNSQDVAGLEVARELHNFMFELEIAKLGVEVIIIKIPRKDKGD